MVAFALAACGGQDDSALEFTGEWTFGPLDEFRARITGFAGDDTSQSVVDETRARERLMQQMIADCMDEQGFTWLPLPDTPDSVTDAVTSDEPLWGSIEWAELYGLGISLQPPVNEEPEVAVDPNLELIEEMSEPELEAWNLALWGVVADEGEATDPADLGCWDRAAIEAWNQQTPDDWVPLEAEMNRHWDRVLEDRRVRDNDAE